MHRNAEPPVLLAKLVRTYASTFCLVGADLISSNLSINSATAWALSRSGVSTCAGSSVVTTSYRSPCLARKAVGGPAQLKPVAEKVVHHIHASALPVL